MKLKTHLIYDCKNNNITWQDDLPVTYQGIEIGKIINININKLTGSIEVEIKIYNNNIEKVKKLIGLK